MKHKDFFSYVVANSQKILSEADSLEIGVDYMDDELKRLNLKLGAVKQLNIAYKSQLQRSIAEAKLANVNTNFIDAVEIEKDEKK